ncbi:LysR family transcriptional regulator [Nakamurella sp. YIM 132087]|uniref:LysR family transcriptional regulator n=1 Tax=Nakamurella alba TaxID=2665158 RepID=A0A7K1FHP0_9ACTN|nr:LysR family transcriptional regulator [Nakamurella alba]MTD13586.1 LysR family transcriptional regulator [Nakamurella alba]
MIDVRRLQLLRELDRCGTIAATAAAVHLTPSAVSQQLAALSKEAGVPMLEPDGRRVRLTAAAQLLLSHAHQVFSHLEHAEADLAAFRRGDAGTVRLGAFATAISALAVPAMADLARDSRLEVHIRETQPEGATDALMARAVDVAVTLTGIEGSVNEEDPRIAVSRLMDDKLDIALPADHPLAQGSDEVSLDDLAEENWILNVPGTPCWKIAVAACARTGFSPRVRHHADDFTGVLALIAAGAGVGVIPRLAGHSLPTAHVVIKPISGPHAPVRRLGLQYRAGTERQPHIAPLLEVLHRVALEASSDQWQLRSVDATRSA